MKKIYIGLVIVAMFVSLLAVPASAQWLDTGAAFDGTTWSGYGELDLDPLVTYNVWYSVTASLQYLRYADDSKSAVLSSNDPSHAVWQVQVTTDGTNWTTYDNLVAGSLTATYGSPVFRDEMASDVGYDISGYSGIRIGYDLTLVNIGTGTAVCSGNGVLEAVAAPVPEPGTILAAISILGPAGLLFRRRN